MWIRKLTLLSLLVLPLLVSAQNKVFKGRAHVINGDTLKLQDTLIRLEGIDAFEKEQACKDQQGKNWGCGKEALNQLKKMIEGQFTICYSNQDEKTRFIATCESNGVNLNRWLVRQGLAVAYRKHSTSYIPEENSAREEKKGGWIGQFRAPWDWRKIHKQEK